MKPPKNVLASGRTNGDDWIEVAPAQLPTILTELKARGFRSWSFMTCVDHLGTPLVVPPKERFELVYQLRNMETREQIRVRAFVPASDPVAPSVQEIFAPANWDERETWDLFGIRFEGHPDLRRILLPDEWVGHPLRRDHPVGGEPVEFSDDHQSWQTAPAEA
ncbi:MAG TPA: NADH-quinone oxidoreductase subunit C [Candidatus Acidoferrales bacterium]|nr:NADH-quinone oxidoreductase subunit C [Candidatus Acidoferrales bacterium]